MKQWKPNELVMKESEVADIGLALRIRLEASPVPLPTIDMQELKDLSVHIVDGALWRCMHPDNS